ncbi:sugar phosphate isomerase/epimerase family protein [Halegenticoccus tardaugens]|uniref:sugar phosphate isomerase/epimerase family protein n=1 Tax=Halegenticoccus tardaugens TaxID=2071624 RepID=UPI00100AE570|nr:sugar phosphate isomerase/epimerase [Halegenticoccus tardaugens]
MHRGIQLYSLRSLDEPVPDLIGRVGETSFEGLEFAGLGGASPDSVVDALSSNELAVAGAHVPIEELESDVDGTIERYRAVGCERLVVPYLPDEAFESDAAVARTADRLSELADRLASRGVACCYHNHDHEFVEIEGEGGAVESAFERLLADADDRVEIELDAGWANAAGYDPVDLLDRFGDRIPIVHLKDVATETRTPVELGDGDLDLADCVAAARRADVDWLVYEHDDPADAVASLERGASTLSELTE